MSDEKVKKDVAVSGPKLNLQKYTAPFEEMERMFNDFLQQRFWGQSWMPHMRFPESTDVSTSIDMFEDGNELVIKADIPGMKKEDIKIDLSDNVLSISGEKKSEEKTEQKDCTDRLDIFTQADQRDLSQQGTSAGRCQKNHYHQQEH